MLALTRERSVKAVPVVKTVIFGGAGFVGLNIAEALLARGDEVVIADRNALPARAVARFSTLPGRLGILQGDVRHPEFVSEAIPLGIDAVIWGVAITAGTARERASPGEIVDINLAALLPVIERARDARAGRLLNLSSVAVYGEADRVGASLTEDCATVPRNLYAITKLASEQVVARLGGLWAMDVANLRLGTVFGPWEYATGVRDTLSPPFQIMLAAEEHRPALLPRDSLRDWLYATDAAAGVLAALDAATLPQCPLNLTGSASWSLLDWGQAIAAGRDGVECRLVRGNETPTIDLHASSDRLPASHVAFAAATGWVAHHRLASSAAHLDGWWRQDHARQGHARTGNRTGNPTGMAGVNP